jgi:TonB family protein
MKSRFRLFLPITLCLLASAVAAAQVEHADATKVEFWLIDPGHLVYPWVARLARIAGDVRVQVQVRKDGSVAKSELLSGPPMLQQAALESAQHSKFQCYGCTEETTSYDITYTFGFRNDADKDCGYRRFRVANCLYLWKCSKEQYVPLPPVIGQSGSRIMILADTPCAMP